MPESTPEKEQHDTIESPYRISWRRLLKIILPIFVLFFAIAYWFVGIYTPSKILAPTTIPTPDFQESTLSAKPATGSAQQNETADWKTYNNTELGVSLKLPSEFPFSQELTSELDGPVTRVNFSDNKDFRSTDPKRTTISVSTCKKCPNYVPYNYVSNLDINKTSTSTLAGNERVQKDTRLANVTIDGLVALKILTVREQNKANKYTYELAVYVKKGEDDYYSIYVRSETKENYDKNIKTFDLIISTIKFLE